ncbi:hypothetical protein COO60DRAFT_1064948 [Scenedesmus sp. NREL 46B-D3]|nr:hypothetical protein COO60DRAFT_1064948 [Scenedesmus sp. NREL 46B-D3]
MRHVHEHCICAACTCMQNTAAATTQTPDIPPKPPQGMLPSALRLAVKHSHQPTTHTNTYNVSSSYPLVKLPTGQGWYTTAKTPLSLVQGAMPAVPGRHPTPSTPPARPPAGTHPARHRQCRGRQVQQARMHTSTPPDKWPLPPPSQKQAHASAALGYKQHDTQSQGIQRCIQTMALYTHKAAQAANTVLQTSELAVAIQCKLSHPMPNT